MMHKILLIEDNEMNRDMLSRRLERKGYTVILAVDGPSGIRMTQRRREHPALAVCLDPRDREIAIRARHVLIGEIELAGVETRNHVHLVTRVGQAILVHLVAQDQFGGPAFHAREARPLDDDGSVAVASISRSGLKVLGQAQLLRANAWTVPLMVGSRLYVRDRHRLLALDLN